MSAMMRPITRKSTTDMPPHHQVHKRRGGSCQARTRPACASGGAGGVARAGSGPWLGLTTGHAQRSGFTRQPSPAQGRRAHQLPGALEGFGDCMHGGRVAAHALELRALEGVESVARPHTSMPHVHPAAARRQRQAAAGSLPRRALTCAGGDGTERQRCHGGGQDGQPREQHDRVVVRIQGGDVQGACMGGGVPRGRI